MEKTNHSFTLGVKLLTGKSFSVVVQATDTISAMKQRVFEREGIPPTRQNLLVMGRLLQPDTRQLQDFAIKAGDMVYVTAGVRGPDAKPGGGLLLAAGAGDSGGVLASPGIPRSAPNKSKDSPMVFGYPVGGASAAASSGVWPAGGEKAVGPATALPTGGKPGPTQTKEDKDTSKDGNSGSGSGSDSDSDSGSGSSMPGTDVGKLRASTIQHYANVTTVLRPHGDAAADPASTSRWPRQSQAYCVYTRKVGEKELTGIVTFGLSNPYQNTFFFAIGIGIEILLECPTPQARLAGSNPNGQVTGATISDGWMFAVVHEIAHQCFALGLQIRQLLEKLQLLSVEIAGVALPAEYVDQETGRCCVLLGHLGDPDVPRGFNVTVPHQHQWILQSVLFVPARVLTRAQCLAIRKDGAEARKKIAEEFVKNKSYSVCDIPAELWPKGGSASTPAPTGTAIAAEKQQETKSVSISTTTSAPKAVSPTSPPPVDTKVPIPVQPETKPVAEKSSSSSLETKMPPPTSTTEDAKKVKASPNPCTDITSVTPTATTTQPRSPFVRSS